MLFATAFLIEFVIGGLSGITFAAAPIDWQVTDTYYVVAHFHYVLFGGTAFAVFAAIYYWFPKMSGRLSRRALGQVHFWLMVIGFNLTFFVQHFLGIMGMPRRVFTYPDLPGWGALNMVSTVGAFIMGLACSSSRQPRVSLRRGRVAATTRGTRGRSSGRRRRRRRRTTSSACPRSTAGGRSGISRTRPTRARPRRRSRKPEPRPTRASSPSGRSSPPRRLLRRPHPRLRLLQLSTKAALAAALDVKKTGAFTACLLASSVTLWLSEKSLERQHAGVPRLALVTIAPRRLHGGQAQRVPRLFERGIAVDSSLFASTFFTLTGFHGLHVTLGLIALGDLAGLAFAGDFREGGKPSRALGPSASTGTSSTSSGSSSSASST
jgi:hypothetical protein